MLRSTLRFALRSPGQIFSDRFFFSKEKKIGAILQHPIVNHLNAQSPPPSPLRTAAPPAPPCQGALPPEKQAPSSAASTPSPEQDALVMTISRLALAKAPQPVCGILPSLAALKRTLLAPKATSANFFETATVRGFLRVNVGMGHSTLHAARGTRIWHFVVKELRHPSRRGSRGISAPLDPSDVRLPQLGPPPSRLRHLGGGCPRPHGKHPHIP